MPKILAFTKYGDAAASSRQRFLQYGPHLAAAGLTLESHPLLDNEYIAALAEGRSVSKVRIAKAYADRMLQLSRDNDGDALWIAYELFPYLPGLMERFAFRSGLPVVVDYDDATFHQYDDARNRLVRAILGDKLAPLLRGASAVTVGNAYLASYVERFQTRVIIVPTVVDTDIYRPGGEGRAVPVIGWIGSPSTWRYVLPILPVLAERCRTGAARFLVVGAGPEASRDWFDGMEIREWAEDREVEDIQEMDVGIMPLPDEPWARGKCGYKLIQYMACGKPAIASPIGVNAEIILDGETGFAARSLDDWAEALDRLLASAALREKLGTAGRARAVDSYSLAVHAPRLVDLFDRLVM